jgi:hypothetical protein
MNQFGPLQIVVYGANLKKSYKRTNLTRYRKFIMYSTNKLKLKNEGI